RRDEIICNVAGRAWPGTQLEGIVVRGRPSPRFAGRGKRGIPLAPPSSAFAVAAKVCLICFPVPSPRSYGERVRVRGGNTHLTSPHAFPEIALQRDLRDLSE